MVAYCGDDDGNIPVRFMFEERFCFGCWPGWPKDRPAFLVGAVYEHWQQQPMEVAIDVEQRFPVFPAELDGCVERLTPGWGLNPAACLGDEARAEVEGRLRQCLARSGCSG